METDAISMESFEACRTCGTFYVNSSNFLRPIFPPTSEDQDMVFIRIQLAAWNIELSENDGLPQYICTGCVLEFQKIFKFRYSCADVRQQLLNFYNFRQENLSQKIKVELPDPDEQMQETEEHSACEFIYVDDLSDGEHDNTVAPFSVPHIPIKEEISEEATVPNDESLPINIASTRVTLPMHEYTSGVEHSIEKETFSDMIGKQEIQCTSCAHISSNEEEYEQHVRLIHNSRNIECHICGKKFKNCSKSRLNFHLKWHKLRKHIKCAQCSYYCDSKGTLSEHVRTSHTKTKCNICSKLVRLKTMKSHMRGHVRNNNPDNEEQFNTSQIDEKEKANLKEVNEKNENVDEKNMKNNEHIICALCDELFLCLIDFKLHIQQYHEEMSYLTDDLAKQRRDCDYSYVADDALTNNDVEKATEESSTNEGTDATGTDLDNFACAQCTQTFGSVDELCKHFENQHKLEQQPQQKEEKSEFNCTVCGKSFELKFSLNRHLKKHKKQKCTK